MHIYIRKDEFCQIELIGNISLTLARCNWNTVLQV